MPPLIGYFHPGRESNDLVNLEWRSRHNLLRRSVDIQCAKIYEEVAGTRDEEALRQAQGDAARFSELESEADRLRLIAREIRKHLSVSGRMGYVCMFVDTNESDILALAENDYYSVDEDRALANNY